MTAEHQGNELRIGAISFAHMHAHSYARAVCALPDAKLVGVADEDENRGRAAAEQYGTRYFSDVDQLLGSGVDAVIVCSENARHKEHVVMAARSDVHVLCEKPIAVTVSDGVEMIEACRVAGVSLATAFPVR
ncbi:MAG TPA: Gfo/Idh/MocA family oxidoreductase, partial [Bacillota bacterium]|nr:Gfo/Idh/MocA family oxidoreductase [Bacillota bacterium]